MASGQMVASAESSLDSRAREPSFLVYVRGVCYSGLPPRLASDEPTDVAPTANRFVDLIASLH